MKKAVMQFIRSLGGSCSYAGNTEKWKLNEKEDGYDVTNNKATLFINDPRKGEPVESIEAAVLNKFGFGLPFTLKTN